MDRALLVVSMLLVTPFAWGAQGASEGCKGTRISFEQQVSQLVAEDTLQVDLFVEQQASTIQQLNALLNRITQQVSNIREQMPAAVHIESTQWRTWPVYDKGRLHVVAWRGRLGYRLIGPISSQESFRTMQLLQRYLVVEQMLPKVSEATASDIRAQLETRLLKEAQGRLHMIAQTLGGQKGRLVQVQLYTRQIAPVPVRMLGKAMAAMNMPAPKIEGGMQTVSVNGHFEGCVAP